MIIVLCFEDRNDIILKLIRLIMASVNATGSNVNGIMALDISIPSYQRAGGRWETKDKLDLLFSILSSYPIGSFVLHAEDVGGNEKMLMDGQQRREALFEMLQLRPIFVWLNSIFGTSSEGFEEKLRTYILKHYLKALSTDEEIDYDPITAVGGFGLLSQLRINLGDTTNRTITYSTDPVDRVPFKMFNLETKFMRLDLFEMGRPPWCAPGTAGLRFNPNTIWIHLADYISTYQSMIPFDTDAKKEHFVDTTLLRMNGTYKSSARKSRDDRRAEMKRHLLASMDEISGFVERLAELLQTIKTHEVGKIELIAPGDEERTDFDLSAVFRLINDGGEGLEPVEILASAPRWNGRIAQLNIDDDFDSFAEDIFGQIKRRAGDHTTKWHVAAAYRSLFDHINNELTKLKRPSLLVESFPGNPNDDKKMLEGFKLKSLFSSYKSTEEKCWKRLCSIPTDEDFWTHKDALGDYCIILKILGGDQYFKHMGGWGWPIITGLHGGSSASMQKQRDTYALLAGLRLLWIRFGSPDAGSNWAGDFKRFTLASRKMIDYWVYHQCGSMMMPPLVQMAN